MIALIIFSSFVFRGETAAIPGESFLIGRCQFFANNGVTCNGKLRCKPSDFQTELSVVQVCSDPNEQSDGVWTANQGVIPPEYTRVPSSKVLVASCEFRANGTYNCVGGERYPDAFWEGVYTGSLNAAFELGQDKWWFQQRSTTTTTTTTTTEEPAVFAETLPNSSEDVNTNADRDQRITSPERAAENEAENEAETSSFGRQSTNNNVDSQETTGSENELQGVTGTRNPDSEGGEVILYTINPKRVFVCEYYTNGFVGCRNCTERIEKVTTEEGNDVNKRTYNCTQPRSGPPLKRWAADNGIVPLTPDPNASPKVVAATCIFEKSTNLYECHGESALCTNENGDRVQNNKCLGGKRWSGDYNGDFAYLS
jgi:hypothetical protein